MSRILLLIACLSFFAAGNINDQLLTPKRTFTHADTLRGTITPERAWWNLIRYEIQVKPDYNKKSIEGENTIRFRAITTGQLMQLDLQEPMNIKAITWHNKSLTYTR